MSDSEFSIYQALNTYSLDQTDLCVKEIINKEGSSNYFKSDEQMQTSTSVFQSAEDNDNNNTCLDVLDNNLKKSGFVHSSPIK